MSPRFEYFVIFADMRTGSNFLETNLNEIEGLVSYGEAFNPNFIGYPKSTDIFGITLNMREADPLRLIEALRKNTDGLPGFRLFSNHDRRILEHVVADPACAKIVLTRTPVDSYVSWKIAAKTGQWKLTELKHRRTEKIRFDPAEFEDYLSKLQSFQIDLQRRLQTNGETAFYVGYDDIQDIDVLNGLVGYLGVEGQLTKLSSKLKKQNPGSLRDKVENFDEMQAALAGTKSFDLNRSPSFEPPRQAGVPRYVAGYKTPALFMPMPGAPGSAVRRWIAALDGASEPELPGDFTQKSLRQWKRKHPGHRSFTVLRHPLARAHAAFCKYILDTGPGTFKSIRRTLVRMYKLPLPDEDGSESYDAAAHRRAFLAFLTFLKGNLSGQTSIRVDPVWASQAEVMKGLAGFACPDMVLRENEIEQGLAQLAAQLGVPAPDFQPDDTEPPVSLEAIYDHEVEAAAREVYQRDYMMFGFEDWR